MVLLTVFSLFVSGATAAPAAVLSNREHHLPEQSESRERIAGWVDAPNIRGTWDILWTSLVTIFMCTYTLLCLNIPAPTDTISVLFRRRLFWMCLATIAPEIVLTYAAGQWSRARRSHPLPLNAKQLHWLIVKNHVPYPETSSEEVWDKSKQDRLAKTITAFQIGYLIVGSIGRAVHGLSITILELNTLGIVVCSLFTAFTWFHKPSDVRRPVHLRSQATIKEITTDAPPQEWKNTPLDFIDENGPGWAMNVQPFMHMPVISPERPIQRIPNDRFPMNPYGIQEYCLCFATLLFTGVHVAGWDFSFPSTLERLLWRVSSLILFGVTAIFWVFETMASWKRLGRWTKLYFKVAGPLTLHVFENKSAQGEIRKTPSERTTLPLPWEFWSIMPIAVLYGVARIFMLLEGFIELRDVDATAFVTVDWSKYIPHF